MESRVGCSGNRNGQPKHLLAHRHRCAPSADWLQTLRCISKQCKSAHFKDENFGSISSTMTAGDWEQLCAEWGGPASVMGPALIIVDLPRTRTLMAMSWQHM